MPGFDVDDYSSRMQKKTCSDDNAAALGSQDG
jgi:hypothetical protein